MQRVWTVVFVLGGFLLGLSGEQSANADERSRGPRKRALLVGINDYLAPHSVPPRQGSERGFRDLRGAAPDARALADVLIARHGFASEDVFVLTNQAATRAAILGVLENQLVASAQPGDLLVFYFGGHGSRAASLLREESDGWDETLVPADAALEVPDIRDKELRHLLNRALDRGAFPTVILDSCFSGSGARGLRTEAAPRALVPAPVPPPDAPAGPRPDERGALLISAAQDDEFAWETVDAAGRYHGAFTWAFLQALSDAAPGESAEDTFLRTRALLFAETRLQEPVLEGQEATLAAPLFEAPGTLASPERVVVALENAREDGTLVLQGGWAHGLNPGSRLRARPQGPREVDVEVVETLGPALAIARRIAEETTVEAGFELPVGTLFELTHRAASPGGPLRVAAPTVQEPLDAAWLEELRTAAAAAGVRWVAEPGEENPTHVLARRCDGWHLLDAEGVASALGPQPAAGTVLASVAPGSALFLSLPIDDPRVSNWEIGPGRLHDGIEIVTAEDLADYRLTGRWFEGRAEYAWVRPDSRNVREVSGLPVATPWRALEGKGADRLLLDLLHLRKLHGWFRLTSPSASPFGYQLQLERVGDGYTPGRGAPTRQGELYHFALTAQRSLTVGEVSPRWLYVFSVDSRGKSVLHFGKTSVENRLPRGLDGVHRRSERAPERIVLDDRPLLEVREPFGLDTYFLLTTDEPLPNPRILAYTGFRGRGPAGGSALEELLSQVGGTQRGSDVPLVPTSWSIERVTVRSLPAGERAP